MDHPLFTILKLCELKENRTALHLKKLGFGGAQPCKPLFHVAPVEVT